jgi:aminocarboxymuconate-semialdehyde decarboxylase
MRTYREFFQDAVDPMADIVFVGCSVTDAAEPLLPSGGAALRRQVVLDGRWVKTVDVHAHCAVPEAMALMGSTVSPQALLIRPERLRQMDAQGIDVEALSINPYWYTAERDLARQLIAIQNEKLAELCAAQPDHFVAFATVALQHPDLAVEQLEDGIKRLGLCGVSIGGSVNGEELSDPKFHPFWAKAEELGVLVFLHPQGSPGDAATRTSWCCSASGSAGSGAITS